MFQEHALKTWQGLCCFESAAYLEIGLGCREREREREGAKMKVFSTALQHELLQQTALTTC